MTNETTAENIQENVLPTSEILAGDISEDILKLKEDIASQYVEELKLKKESGLTGLIIGEGTSLKDYLVSKSRSDKIWDNLKGGLMSNMFNAIDKQSFEIDGTKYTSVFDYLKPMKERLDAANTPEALATLKSEILTGAAAATTTPTTTPDVNSEILEEAEIDREDYVYPVKGAKINSPVGPRHIDGMTDHVHKGVDIAAIEGTSISSIADGEVESVGFGGVTGFDGYGNYMVVKLKNGYRVLYGHMKKLAQNKEGTLRKVGDRIKGGEQVGLMGNTGTSTGAHLHLEIREGKFENDTINYFSREYLDPIAVLPVTKDMINDNILARVDQTAIMDIDENLPMAA